MNGPIIALKALLAGKEVTFPDGVTYVLIEEGGQYHLRTKAMKLVAGGMADGAQVVLLTADHASVDYFVNQANRMSDDELIIMAAETVLMEDANSKERI